MCFDEFRIRFRIFRTLVRRFFTPRDSFFFNSIVFDIWYIARNAEILGEIAERAPAVVINDSDHEELLLNGDEAGDAELVATLAQAGRDKSRSWASASHGLNSQARVSKVKFTPRSVSLLRADQGFEEKRQGLTITNEKKRRRNQRFSNVLPDNTGKFRKSDYCKTIDKFEF